MDVDYPETVPSTSQPCTPFNPMAPSTSRVPTPGRPSSRIANRQYGSPFRATPQNMEPSNSRVQELRDAAVGKRSYTNDWMQNGYSMQPQGQMPMRPPSHMGSNMSTMSNMSEMTTYSYGGLSVLSVNTECGQFDTWMNQSQQQALTRVSHSSTENQDPMRMRKRMSTQEICQNLRSPDMMTQVEAIRVLEPVAKAKQFEQMWGKPELEMIFRSLFEALLPRPVEQENENVIRKVFEILNYSIKTSRSIYKIFLTFNQMLMEGRHNLQIPRPYSIYEIVMERAKDVDTKYESVAMILFVHLCCEPYLMKHVFHETVKLDAVRRLHPVVTDFAMEVLRKKDARARNRGLAVSLIKNLSMKNRAIKEKAQQMDVVGSLFVIMREEQHHEDLLWSTMKALTTFCQDGRNGEHFIRLGGAQVLCGLLSHGSTRLLYELLGCMRRLSDLPAIKEQNMEESIHCIVQLMGSSDVIIVERATGTLRNIGSHNKQNKVYMVQNGVTNHALAVLRTSSQFMCQPGMGDMRQKVAEIYENVFSILSNVTLMAPQDIKESAVQACHMISQNTEAAHILFHYFNIGSRKCRKLAVTVIKKVIETVPAFAEPFVDLVGSNNEMLPMLLLQRAWQSLEEWYKTSKDIVTSVLAPESPERRMLDERKRDHEDIVKRSVGLLTNLCTNANPAFFMSLKPHMESGSFNPFLWLNKEMNEIMLIELLNFIYSISTTEESLKNELMLKMVHQAKVPDHFFHELYRRWQDPRIQDLINKIYTLASNQSGARRNQNQQM